MDWAHSHSHPAVVVAVIVPEVKAELDSSVPLRAFDSDNSVPSTESAAVAVVVPSVVGGGDDSFPPKIYDPIHMMMTMQTCPHAGDTDPQSLLFDYSSSDCCKTICFPPNIYD